MFISLIHPSKRGITRPYVNYGAFLFRREEKLIGMRLNSVIFMINLISSLYLTVLNNWAKQRRVINETCRLNSSRELIKRSGIKNNTI
jgi:hypothetical protein